MIIALGTTPTVSRSMVFDRLLLDDVNRTADVVDYAAGKNVNVARVLTTLGEPVIATGCLGGDRARLMRRDMDAAGIRHDFVDVTAPTRLCVTLIDRADGTATELIEESPAVTPADAQRLLEKLRELFGRLPHAEALTPSPGTPGEGGGEGSAESPSHRENNQNPHPPLSRRTGRGEEANPPPAQSGGYVRSSNHLLVLSGSLAPGVPLDFYRRCVEIASAAGVRSIVDAVGEPLNLALAARPFVVKPNRAELSRTVGRPIESSDELKTAIEELIANGPTWVVVTMGAAGAVVSDGRTFMRLRSPSIQPVSAIGSGDSFAAGLAAGLARGQTVPQATRLAIACGAANALTDRAAHLSLQDVERYLHPEP